jgi:hypothetical protein
LACTLVGNPPTSELLYANAFNSSAAAFGISLPPLYPLGAAANYSLLYVVLRALTETPASRVLDIGVGQSTRLLNAIAKWRQVDIVSLESDGRWAALVAQHVSHPVLHSPLTTRNVHGFNVPCFASANITGRFDLIIVDGPEGSRRRSRWGVLEILDQHLSEEFLVIFDDASRSGELDTIKQFVKSRGKGVAARFVHAGKSQCLIYTQKFDTAGIF